MYARGPQLLLQARAASSFVRPNLQSFVPRIGGVRNQSVLSVATSINRVHQSTFQQDQEHHLLSSPSHQYQHEQNRHKHSSTQVKRLFNKHPARRRVERRLGIDRTPAPPPPRKFDPVFDPVFLPNGWSAPPIPANEPGGITIPDYPFQVQRTKDKPNDAAGFLPVYTKYRKDGTKVVTRIRRVQGDRELFVRELRSVLQVPAPRNGKPKDDDVCIRSGGTTIEVKGNRAKEIRAWLAGLGF